MEFELTEEQIKELAGRLLFSFPDLPDVNGTIIRAEKYTSEIIYRALRNDVLLNYDDAEISEIYPTVVEECISSYLTTADDPKGYISTLIFLDAAKNRIAYLFELENLTELDYIVRDIIDDKYTELNNSEVKMQAKKEYPEAFENPVVIVKKRKYGQQ